MSDDLNDTYMKEVVDALKEQKRRSQESEREGKATFNMELWVTFDEAREVMKLLEKLRGVDSEK